jgi:hypothetical protein
VLVLFTGEAHVARTLKATGDEHFTEAKRTDVASPLISIKAGKLSRKLPGALAICQFEALGYAAVANRVGRQA